MSGYGVSLSDPERYLLEEIADPDMTSDDVALTYRLALRSDVDWGRVNRAIVDRWSVTTLRRIKKQAWETP